MSISKQTIENIRLNSDIIDVIGSHLQLKRGGTSYKALCPFHKEKTPSFSVNPQRQSFHCFGCSGGGDVFKFVMEFEGVDFITAVKLLAQRAGMQVDFGEESRSGGGPKKDILYEIHQKITEFYQQALCETEEGKKALAYLAERTLEGEVTEQFHLGYAPNRRNTTLDWGRKHGYTSSHLEEAGLIARAESRGTETTYDRFRGRLMIPIKDDIQRVIAFSGRTLKASDPGAKYINSPETAIFHKGRVLFGMNKARRSITDNDMAILCEGQIDVMRCQQNGIMNAVAPQGTALTKNHACLIKRSTDAVTLVYDADTAGQDAALRSGKAFLEEGVTVRIAALPPGEDPDSLILTKGPEAFNAVIKNARSLIEYQIDVWTSRETTPSEVSSMRLARSVLDTISHANSQVQQEQLIKPASDLLGISQAALQHDLRDLIKKRTRTVQRTPKVHQERPSHPTEELGLAELLYRFNDLCELVKTYLPLQFVKDPDCKVLLNKLLHRPQDNNGSLTLALAEENEECRRLAAQFEHSPNRTWGGEYSPQEEGQSYIQLIVRKSKESELSELVRRRDQAPNGDEWKILNMECAQLTLDISALKQDWEKALPILEMIAASILDA